jgi:hypothetical protein
MTWCREGHGHLEGSRMNLAVGFPCPTCGHEEANLLGIEKDQNAEVVGLQFLCTRCESVFGEARINEVEELTPVAAESGRGGH